MIYATLLGGDGAAVNVVAHDQRGLVQPICDQVAVGVSLVRSVAIET